MTSTVSQRPLIVLSNDDGVEAQGLELLARELREVGDLLLVAPDGERSASSHSVSISGTWRYERVGEGEFAVNGTPADCVYLGVTQLAPRRPALVVSGINDGYNLGTDVFYSGTVAAAAEGAVLQLPAIAISTDRGAPPEAVLRAARFGAALASWIIRRGWDPPHTLLNVNVPPSLGDDAGRYRLTAQGTRVYRSAARQRETWPDRGVIRLTRPGAPATEGATGEDADALRRGLISVTPLRLDLTAPGELERLGRELCILGFESEPEAGER